jgi:hypothetical protein
MLDELHWVEPRDALLRPHRSPADAFGPLAGFLVRVRRAVDAAWAQRAAQRLFTADLRGELTEEECATMLRILGVREVSVFLRRDGAP